MVSTRSSTRATSTADPAPVTPQPSVQTRQQTRRSTTKPRPPSSGVRTRSSLASSRQCSPSPTPHIPSHPSLECDAPTLARKLLHDKEEQLSTREGRREVSVEEEKKVDGKEGEGEKEEVAEGAKDIDCIVGGEEEAVAHEREGGSEGDLARASDHEEKRRADHGDKGKIEVISKQGEGLTGDEGTRKLGCAEGKETGQAYVVEKVDTESNALGGHSPDGEGGFVEFMEKEVVQEKLTAESVVDTLEKELDFKALVRCWKPVKKASKDVTNGEELAEKAHEHGTKTETENVHGITGAERMEDNKTTGEQKVTVMECEVILENDDLKESVGDTTKDALSQKEETAYGERERSDSDLVERDGEAEPQGKDIPRQNAVKRVLPEEENKVLVEAEEGTHEEYQEDGHVAENRRDENHKGPARMETESISGKRKVAASKRKRVRKRVAGPGKVNEHDVETSKEIIEVVEEKQKECITDSQGGKIDAEDGKARDNDEFKGECFKGREKSGRGMGQHGGRIPFKESEGLLGKAPASTATISLSSTLTPNAIPRISDQQRCERNIGELPSKEASVEIGTVSSDFERSIVPNEAKDSEGDIGTRGPVAAMNSANGENLTLVQNNGNTDHKFDGEGILDEMALSPPKSSEETQVDVLKFAESPERFLRRSEAINQQCRELIRQSYCDQSRVEFGQDILKPRLIVQKRKRGLPPLGPVLTLDIGQHFDCDQLWEEIEMRNRPLLAHLQRRLASLMFSHKKQMQNKISARKGGEVIADRKSQTEDVHLPSLLSVRDSLGAIAKSQPDGGHGTDDLKNLLEAETEAENDSRVLAGNVSSGIEPEGRGALKVRFAPGTKGGEPTEINVGNGDSIEDGFFSLADMEMFADDAEQLANQGKLIASDDEDETIGDDEDNYNGNEGDHQNGIFRNSVSASPKGTEKLRYNDFFDPPNEGLVQSKVGKVSSVLSSYEEEEENDASEETPLEASRFRTRKLIEAIEEESIGKKPWQLRGEVTGFSRPKDSLLNAEIDFGTTANPNSVMDTDKNETIEDVIRQRIVDGLFDDVISPVPDGYTKENKKTDELPEISQEKPKEGLADIYAREFLGEKERAKDELRTKEVRRVQKQGTSIEETDEQKEVNRLFDKLASKLDALSGLHFTPGLTKTSQEMTVNRDVRALTSEEAIPEAVSGESLLTPREVFSVDKKKLTGEVEKTKQERRTAHRRVKRGIKKQNDAKARATRLMEQASPALAEKRRAEEALRRRGKKIRLASPDPRATNVKAT